MQRNIEFENRIMKNRTIALCSIVLFLFGILFLRVYYLQVGNFEKYKSLSKNNVLKDVRLSPKRGDIYDINGELIASSRPLFQLVVTPERIQDYSKDREVALDNFFLSLNEIIKLDGKEQRSLRQKINNSKSFQEVVIKVDLTVDELSEIASNLRFLDGVHITSKTVRYYPYDDTYLPVLGYVSKISPKEINNLDEKYISSDYIGKAGLERRYDYDLYGDYGIEKIAINAYGKIIERKKYKEAENGSDIVITIDHELQKKSMELLGDYHGAIVAVDPNNGNILALASKPTYDANQFITGISHSEYREHFAKASPLFNRAIQGKYHPASTIKPFLALAALEGEWIDPKEKIWSGDYYQINWRGRKFREWKRGGHGNIDMAQSIEVSSDVYYYQLAHTMGIDYISEFLRAFNFGNLWGIDLYGEIGADLPSKEWKKKKLNEPWYGGETVNVGIGQGHLMVTPLQLAMSTSILANGGRAYKPNLLADHKPDLLYELSFSQKNLDIVERGMIDVMHGSRGTARSSAKGLEFKIAGKTGTAQVISTNGQEIKDNEDLPLHLRDHALFIGYAPAVAPEIAIAVVVEHGSSGGKVAAPIARELIELYVNKNKQKIEGLM